VHTRRILPPGLPGHPFPDCLLEMHQTLGGGSGGSSGGGGKPSAAAASNPELEKSREAAAAALRILKEILGAADGGAGTRKCD
jgi:hypothetical protein